MSQFENDFYGEELRAVALGFERTELDFKSLGSRSTDYLSVVDDLIQAIKDDITYAEVQLDMPDLKSYQNHQFFQ